MHGLVNRALQSFLRDTFGQPLWETVAVGARIHTDGFESMLLYDHASTEHVLSAAAGLLRRPRESLLEDFGHYLVSHPNLEPLRRLLRFSGSTFTDFLLGLEDMRGRARLAVPDLDLPDLDLVEESGERFALHCRAEIPGSGHVLLGLLRAMADDYGALVFLDHLGTGDGAEVISIQIVAARHTAGRAFALSPQAN